MPKIVDGNIVASVDDDAQDRVLNIPNWATWTSAQADTWLNANITDAKTRQAMSAMVSMLFALRDKAWPNLAD